MATDGIAAGMASPLGLIVLGFAIAVGHIPWILILGLDYRIVGSRPLLAGYATAIGGLFVVTFLTADLWFSERVSAGSLMEGQRWTMVPGWTAYLSAVFLPFVLLIIDIVGVPLTAFLVRSRSYGLGGATAVHFGLLFLPSSAMLVTWINGWHDLPGFVGDAGVLLFWTFGIGAPFAFATLFDARRRILRPRPLPAQSVPDLRPDMNVSAASAEPSQAVPARHCHKRRMLVVFSVALRLYAAIRRK